MLQKENEAQVRSKIKNRKKEEKLNKRKQERERERERIEVEKIPGGEDLDKLGHSESCESRNEWIIRKD